jgi:hypothetical protein
MPPKSLIHVEAGETAPELQAGSDGVRVH